VLAIAISTLSEASGGGQRETYDEDGVALEASRGGDRAALEQPRSLCSSQRP